MFKSWREKIRARLNQQAHVAVDLFDERNHLASARQKFLGALPYWIAGAATALAAIIYAQIFHRAELLAAELLVFAGYGLLVITPSLFLVSWWLVDRFAPYANGSGIPQLMAASELTETPGAAAVIPRLLGLRIILVKVASSLVAVVGGGAIGREGPTLQIAGSIFDLTNRYLPARLKIPNRQGMILAGGAAGLAAAFNTPLGGIAYVIEELAKSHLSFFRTGILHAVVVAGLISQVVMGSYLYFGYPKLAEFSWGQVGMVILVSLSAGLVGALFGQFLKYIFQLRALFTSRGAKALAALTFGFLFALLIVFVTPKTMGSGREVIDPLLFREGVATPADLFARFIGSGLTFASGGAGGIFAPTLAIGGATGSLVATFVLGTLLPLAALAGMTAALAALTHSPLTAFILILEMTDRHSSILPLMMAAMIGQGVSKLISKQSFYEFVAQRLVATLAPSSAQSTRDGDP
ncbi:MAG: chloride channel protein [Bdellovibrionaceae bacterium]|nr:chloride channel protein [Pseudobdellovibrionaceae bacterium]